MVSAGADKAYRHTILRHSLKGMEVHYIGPTDDDPKAAIDRYTVWLDDKIASAFQSSDQKPKKDSASVTEPLYFQWLGDQDSNLGWRSQSPKQSNLREPMISVN